jgi:hypothetical protein
MSWIFLDLVKKTCLNRGILSNFNMLFVYLRILDRAKDFILTATESLLKRGVLNNYPLVVIANPHATRKGRGVKQ